MFNLVGTVKFIWQWAHLTAPAMACAGPRGGRRVRRQTFLSARKTPCAVGKGGEGGAIFSSAAAPGRAPNPIALGGALRGPESILGIVPDSAHAKPAWPRSRSVLRQEQLAAIVGVGVIVQELVIRS